MNCNTAHDRETYEYYQAAINALELRLLEDNPGCPVPPQEFVPSASKDTALTAFAQLGALRLNVNRGLISLLDGSYQYVLAEATRTLSLLPNIEANPDDDLWLGSVIIPRSRGICEHVLSLGDMINQPTDANSNVPAIVINDLAEDPRFSNRSYVKSEPGVRFYAGVPLRSPWGTIIGAYCVFGHEPRNGLTQEQLMALQGISSTVMTYLETSKAKEGHQRYEQMLHGLASFVAGEPSLHSFEDQSTSSEKSSTQPRISHDDSVVSKQTTSSPSNTVPQHSELPKTPPERVQSPRTKKRPRDLSTPTPMARKKSTMSLQEIMLPSGSKRMFARAANIVRESIDLCGCIIFDASVASFGGAINTPHRRSSVEARFGNLDTCSSETSSGQASGSDHPSPPGEPWEFGTHHSGLARDHLPDRKLCDVLGFSYRDSESIVSDDEDVCCAELPESDLKRLLRKYPFGHIFNISSSGDISPSQEDDYPAVTASSLEAAKHKGARQLTTRELPTNKSSAMLQKLLEVAPGARSIAILPLWDYQRDRWFAGCLCWTTEPSRILYPDVDLIYLQAFGNSIMMELSRLDAISSDRAKTTFVASISHELRCPLHGILGGVQFLQDTQLNPYQSGMLESVAMCGRTLLDTIDHVLDFAKVNTFSKLSSKTSSTLGQENIPSAGLKSSQVISEPETLFADIDLALLTEEVVEAVFVGQAHRGVLSRLEQTADQNTTKPSSSNATLPSDADRVAYYTNKAICVILDIPHRASWFVETQPGAWRRIVMNLFGNALKYTTSGQIRVSLRIKPPELSPKQDSGNIEVTLVVSDSGKGISPEYLRGGLWRPFSQEDSSTPGTGLGLSIVRQIVQGLKGKIGLKSEIEAGTEVMVSVSLPLTENPPGSGDDDHFFSLAAAQLRDCPVCILEATTPDGLDGPSPVVQKSRREFGISLSRTLKEWFGADAVVSNMLTALSAKVIFCLEPQLDFLATLKGLLSPEKRPLVIFITLDASETARLRADPRVNGRDFVVEVITQPCGPRKLARSLTHALDRRDKRVLPTLTPLTSPVKDSPETNSPAQEWKSPNWIPTHLGNAQSGSHARSNSIMDPNSIPRSLLDKYATNTSMQQPPTESQLRILLVDDNRINLSLLTAFMRRYNFNYEEAMNGLQAVETYQQANGEFDYVLMDLTMPVMDGMAATREIRRYEQREGIRPTFVIALTGLASATARVAALNSGINYFLTKPVKFQALHQILKGAISES